MAYSVGLREMTEFVNLVFLNRFGDEFHYLFERSYFQDQRRMYLPIHLSRHPNPVSIKTLMNTKDLPALFKLGKFCKDIISTFKVIYRYAFKD